jgi:hypothetical protein
MFEFLLYTSLTCQQAEGIILRMQASEYIESAFKVELVETVKESTPECYWDAND